MDPKTPAQNLDSTTATTGTPAPGKGDSTPARGSQEAGTNPEKKVEAQPDPKKVDGARFAQLAKKERELVKQKQEFAAAQAQLAEQRKEYEAYVKFKGEAKQNPLAVLEAIGVSYDELTQFVLNDKKAPPNLEVKALKDDLENFKKQQAEEKQKLLEEEKQRIEQARKEALERFTGECEEFLKERADHYEFITMYEGLPHVIATIEEHHRRTNKILSFEEAANLVENYFEDQVKKAAESKKYKEKLSGKPTNKEPQKNTEVAQTRTLTNDLTTSTVSVMSNRDVDNDRMKRALAKLG